MELTGIISQQIESWNYTSNRRKFFEKYAKEHGFDSRDPAGWYTQPSDKILSSEASPPTLSLFHSLFSSFFNIKL
jgi:hypothetical protein